MTRRLFLILILLVSVSFDSLAQITVRFENGEEMEVVGLADIMSKDANKKIRRIKNGKAEMTIDISNKSLLIFGYKGEFYFLFGVPGQEYVFDCLSNKISGGDERIGCFLDEWNEKYFNLANNNLKGKMYYLAAQNSTIKVAKRKQIESDAFLAPEFLPDLKKSYNKQEKMLRKLKCKDKDFTKIFSDFLYIGYWEQLSKATFLLRSRDIEVPEKLLDELLKMDVEKPHFVEKFYAKDWLNYYIKAIEDKKLITPTLKDYVLKTAVYFKNPELREFYVLNELEKKIKSNNLVFFEELFSSASSCVVSSEGKKKFLELFNKGKSALSEDKFDGVKAEEFVFITADGKEVALSDFKGKYVYIDFWATWCGPCKQETPHFKRLAERMQGNNIVFLSISVDNKGNEKIWKKYVQEHGLQKYCVAGWTGKGFKNSFISHYRINAIPRFMLVGPDGNMIYNDCWRPSSVQIDKLLNSFLN